MKKLLSDQFPLYDAVFEELAAEFKLEKYPTWQHKWLFRYLQISPSYLFVNQMMQDNTDEKAPIPDEVLDLCPGPYKVLTALQAFGDVTKFDFTRWWFLLGQYHFYPKANYEVQKIVEIEARERLTKARYNEGVQNYDNYLADVYRDNFYPQAVVLGIPMSKNKKEVLKKIEEFIDENFVFGQPNTTAGTYTIHKNKMQEKTVRDCYRALEIRLRYPELSLIEVAKRAKTLTTSIAGLVDGVENEASKSVRAGIRRQIRTAIILAENAARGSFPNSVLSPGLHGYMEDESNEIHYSNMIETNKKRCLNKNYLRKELNKLGKLPIFQRIYKLPRFT